MHIGITASAACLLSSQYAPASAQLFAEIQRLRRSLPLAEAIQCSMAENRNRALRPAEVMTAVHFLMSRTNTRPENAELRSRSLQRHAFCICVGSMQKLWLRFFSSTHPASHNQKLWKIPSGQQCGVWPQTLNIIWMIASATSELCEGDVPSARIKGLVCRRW